MLDVFGSIKDLVKYKPKTIIDNDVFKLHYKFTFIALLACSIVVTSRQYVGDPIDCITDEIPMDIMDTYCWIYSTFTVPKHLTGRLGIDVVQPGVGFHNEENTVKHHKYYQWVCFVLFFQALLFYFPHYLWKTFETGRIDKLVSGLHTPLVPEDVKKERIETITEYFKSYVGKHNNYAIKYFLCETLNLINVIAQIFIMDYFLDGEFTTYGWKVVEFSNLDPDDRIDPMAQVFPKVTKCSFNKYGPSGTVQKFDGLCVLPVNIINEKIYVFLWFWFVALSLITGICYVYRIVWLAYRPARSMALKSRCLLTNPNLVGKLLSGKSKDMASSIKNIPQKIDQLGHSNRYSFGDDFLLYQIGINTDPGYFNEIILSVSNVVSAKYN